MFKTHYFLPTTFRKTLLFNYFQCFTDGDIQSVITTEDFTLALEGFTPAALRGVSLHTAGELGWSDVGGLAAVKEALMETLLWPAKVWSTT